MGFFDKIPGRDNRGFAGGTFVPAESAPAGPVHLKAPNTRELRTQAVHRLQVGLFGLAGMLLLVSLANVIMDRAQQIDATAAAPTASASAAQANDPLVDMGVAPELPVGAKTPTPSPAPKDGQNH